MNVEIKNTDANKKTINDETKNADSSKKMVSIKNLYLDPNNFRLIHELEYVKVDESQIKDKSVIQRTFKLVAGEKNQNIQDLIDSFKTNGYLPVDQIQVKELNDGSYLVVEGNRRIASLKQLAREYEEKGIDIGKLNPSIFSKVPVVLYEDADEMHYLTVMALKHISGNKKWGEWNQAKLLEKMHSSFNLSEDDICARIVIQKAELRRSLRALSFVEQYLKSDYGDQFNESKFPIFREVARNAVIKEWIGWDDTNYKATNLVNSEFFFSLISCEPQENEDDNGQAGFGEKYSEPAINKREDAVTLGKILSDKRALEHLKATRDINAAYRASDIVFRERQDAAIKAVASEIDTLSQMSVKAENLPELESALGRLQSVVDKTKSIGLAGVEQNNVFHDRISSHFTKLTIKNFKKLLNLKISKISKINLLAGINNSGKTSLLEAIYLLSKQNDFGGLLEIIRRRGKVSEERLNSEWFLDQLPNLIDIEGVFDEQSTSVSIKHYLEDNSEIDKSRYLKTVEITSLFGNINQESFTRIFKGRNRETQAGSIKIICPTVFSSPFFLNEPHRYTSFYHKSTQSKALPKIFDFIRKDVVKSVNDIRLVDELQRFLVDDKNFEISLDLTEYGEGLQRIFFISLLFASAQNGIILIDEFENAIHTELIGDFARFIYSLSELFNVQVFLTSHSKECIDVFIKNVSAIDDFAFHALVDDGGQIIAREYSGKEFKALLDSGNVDLRRAK